MRRFAPVEVGNASGVRVVVFSPDRKLFALGHDDGSVSLPASAWTVHSGSIYKASLADTPLQLFSAAGNMTVRLAPSTPIAMGDNVGLTVSSRHNNWFDAKTTQRIEL